jgi:hypothetical protein
MGKLLLVLAVVGALVIAGGAYFYFFYGDDTLSAELDETNDQLIIKGPKVDMKLNTNKIDRIELDTMFPGSQVKGAIDGTENAKIKSGSFAYGSGSGLITKCIVNYYKEVASCITVFYERDNEIMIGDITGCLVFNLDTEENTKAFAEALRDFTGAPYSLNGY